MSEDKKKTDPQTSDAGTDQDVSIDPVAINVLMHEKRHFPPQPGFSEQAHIGSMEQYEEIYQRSIDDPEGFWAQMAEEHLVWQRKWDKVLEYDFYKPEISWFIGGKLNVSYNCLDRHLTTWRRNKAALVWESDSGHYRTFTYHKLSL